MCPDSDFWMLFDLWMIMHATDCVAWLAIRQDVSDDAGAALLAPLAALPVDLVLIGGIPQVTMLPTVQNDIPGRSANVVHALHGFGQTNALVLIGFYDGIR